MTGRLRHLLAGGALMLALSLGLAALSAAPVWRVIPEGHGLLRISFTHGGDRSASCRQLSEAERAKLPANMRRTEVCDRARPPLWLELDIDGETVLARSLPPSGLASDGPSRVYKRFVLPAGSYDIAVRMRDRPGDEGFDHAAAQRVTLAPGDSFVIDFDPARGGFLFL